jgi:hypothetical protein
MRSIARLDITRPLSAVWPIVAAFDQIHRWHPLISTCVIEPGPVTSGVGAVRRIETVDGGVIRERLTELDEASGRTGYEFVESPFPVTSYQALITLTPTGENSVHADWWADFEPTVDPDRWEKFFGEQVFLPGLEAIADGAGLN